MAGLIILAIVTCINGCFFWPISQKELIGVYQSVLQDGTPGLPDGGTEMLELKSDSICEQNIALKNGRKFLARGTWKYEQGNVVLKNIHNSIDMEDKINPDIENTTGFQISSSVGRTLGGRILIGSREVTHYEKK